MKEDILERRIRTTLENAGYPLPAISKFSALLSRKINARTPGACDVEQALQGATEGINQRKSEGGL